MTFAQVRIRGSGGAFASCRSVSPEIAEVMVSQGLDPDRINTIQWPAIGASRFATATVLMHSTDLDNARSIQFNGGIAGGPTIFLDLLFADLTFQQMVVGRVVPILATQATRSLFVVELHCRRWLWRQYRARSPGAVDAIDSIRGYNVRSVLRGRTIDRTKNGANLWTPKEIVERILAGDAANGIPALQQSTDVYVGEVGTVTGLPLTDTSRPGFDFGCDDNAPGMIDRTLAKAGAVFVFVPSATAGKAYDIAIHHVGSGEARAATFLNTFGQHLSGGGLETIVDPAVASSLSAGARQWAYAPSDFVRRDCPQKVRVYFPLCLSDNAESSLFPSGAASQIDARLATVPTWDVTPSNRPFTTSADPNSPELYHIFDDFQMTTKRAGSGTTSDIITSTEMQNRAEQVARCYYQRFAAGACDMWMRGVIPLTSAVVWSGAQEWTWRIGDEDDELPVSTHIRGDRNCPLFGYAPLSESNKVHAFGPVTAFRGPDGAFRVIGHIVGHIPAMIRIKSDTSLGSNQWEYPSKILQRDSTDPSGWVEWADITARNSVERNNTATFVGPSYKFPLATGGTFAALAIGKDRDGVHTDIDVPAFIVEDRSVSAAPIAIFGLSNAIDGVC